MIAVLQSLVLKTAIIVITLNCCSAPDCSVLVAKMNVTIRNAHNSMGSTTPVIRWFPQTCNQTKITGWWILIRKSGIGIEEFTNDSSNSFTFAKAETCQKYSVAIQTQYQNGEKSSSTPEQHFQSECPKVGSNTVNILLPSSVIVLLVLIAIIIALLLSRKRKQKEALGKESENYIDKRSLESRTPSNRLSSINRNKVSYCSNGNAEIDLNCLPQPMNIRNSFDVKQVRMEFFLINNLSEKETDRLPRTSAQRPENKFKNRFLNTHPYDFNRVLLSQSEDGYINASFIPGFAVKEKEYIAAQGPKNNTLNDFWQMILEQDVRLIAMVTSLFECGKKKCEKYWPDKGELGIYGDNTQIELLEETTYSFYTTRMFASKAPNFKRTIQQFHFTAWPDFETPDQPEELIQFIEIVRRTAKQLNLSSPIVVHCSAGVGRTGTFIALDYLMQQVLITELIDIPKIVRHLRRFRTSMVQSEAQYVFLYSCIAHYVKTRLNQIKE